MKTKQSADPSVLTVPATPDPTPPEAVRAPDQRQPT
jgi:hypothetical protein